MNGRNNEARAARIIIQPKRGWRNINFSELWDYRELLFFLAWRDVSVRYKQTVLGVAWAVIQPFFTMVVFSLFFGMLARIPSDGIPYPIFCFSALLPWQYFSTSLNRASNSLVDNSNLLSKVYFPRLVVPVSSVLPPLVDFCIAFTVLIGLMMYYGVGISAKLIFVPVFLALSLITALGTSLWLAALNVRYRDIRYIIPFLTQIWMFSSPVIYPASMVPEKWRILYRLNPMSGVIEGMRWSLFGSGTGLEVTTIAPAVVSIALLVSGSMYFSRVEKHFADVV